MNKKLGKYYEAVGQGLEIMRRKVNMQKLKVELYFAKKNGQSTAYPCRNSQLLRETQFFDGIFRRVLGILAKHGREVEADKEEKVWFHTIDSIHDLKSDDTLLLKSYCQRFIQKRINILVQAMVEVIPLGRFLDHTVAKYHDAHYKYFQEVILQIIHKQTAEENVLTSANQAIAKFNHHQFQSFSQTTKLGITYRARTCYICKRYLDFNGNQDTAMPLEGDD